MALETEMAFYKKLLPSLAGEQGRFCVIHKETLVGTFVAYEDALKAGYEKCGLEPFMVKKISTDEQIAYFSRDLNCPCPV